MSIIFKGGNTHGKEEMQQKEKVKSIAFLLVFFFFFVLLLTNSNASCNQTITYSDTQNYTIANECTKENDIGGMPLATIIILPMLLSFIFLIGSAVLGEQHQAFKIALFLLSIIPFFVSLHLAIITLVNYYDFTDMQNIIGDTVYWMGLMFGVIVVYFIIYLFYNMVHNAAQKKREELEY